MVTIFIWAARFPAVAVGLYAVLASLVPLLSLPRPNLGAGAVYPMLLANSNVKKSGGASVKNDIT